MDRLQIVVWKWRHPRKSHVIFDFSADAVNKLRADLDANLSLPHDVVCITDDANGLDSRIRVVPLWSEGADLGGCWRRLKVFSPEMRTLIGPRFAWIDLDSVVVGPLDDIFARSEDAVFYRSNSVTGTPYNGSLVLMDAGARAEVWNSFDPTRSPGVVRDAGLIGTDQAWIAHVLGSDQPVWDARDGVMYFTRDCVPDLPPQSRVVFFAGPLKAHMVAAQRQAPWLARRMAPKASGAIAS